MCFPSSEEQTQFRKFHLCLKPLRSYTVVSLKISIAVERPTLQLEYNESFESLENNIFLTAT